MQRYAIGSKPLSANIYILYQTSKKRAMELRAKIKDSEYRVVELLAHGYSVEDIADELCLAVGTVRNRIADAKLTIGCRRETQLCAWYYYSRFGLSLNLAPKTRRIGAFIACLLFMFGTVCTDAQRVRPARRGGRRNEETEFIL